MVSRFSQMESSKARLLKMRRSRWYGLISGTDNPEIEHSGKFLRGLALLFGDAVLDGLAMFSGCFNILGICSPPSPLLAGWVCSMACFLVFTFLFCSLLGDSSAE